jgi:H+/gluconate symporter-like permease
VLRAGLLQLIQLVLRNSGRQRTSTVTAAQAAANAAAKAAATACPTTVTCADAGFFQLVHGWAQCSCMVVTCVGCLHRQCSSNVHLLHGR